MDEGKIGNIEMLCLIVNAIVCKAFYKYSSSNTKGRHCSMVYDSYIHSCDDRNFQLNVHDDKSIYREKYS